MLARAASSGIASQIAKAALQACGTILFARMLGPREVGLFAVVLPFVVLGQQFASAGLAQYLLHNPDITGKRLDTLAATSFYLSLLVAGLLILASFPVAQLLDLPIAGPMLAAMSITLVVESYCAFLRSLTLRAQQYTWAAKVDVVSAALGLLIGIIHATISPTAWVLVSQALATALAGALLFAASTKKLPSTFNPLTVTKISRSLPGVATYASWLVSFGVVNQVARNLDNVLIGWYWGPQFLGPYALGYRLLMLPLQVFNAPLSNVVLLSLPTCADRERSTVYARLARLSTFLGCSTILIMNVNVSVFADVVLGPQWASLAGLFHVLAISAAFQSITSLTGCLYQLTNNTRVMFTISAGTTVVTVTAFVGCLSWGPMGIAVVYSILNAIFFLPVLLLATSYGRISFRISLQYSLPCLGLALALIFLGTAADQYLQQRELTLRILFGVTFGTASVVALALASFGFQIVRVRSAADISKAVFG